MLFKGKVGMLSLGEQCNSLLSKVIGDKNMSQAGAIREEGRERIPARSKECTGCLFLLNLPALSHCLTGKTCWNEVRQKKVWR